MSEDKSNGVVSDLVTHLAALFRHMLPGVIIIGGARLAYPEWFTILKLDVTGHLIVLGVITIAVGNTWFALNRYGLHQLIDLVLYWTGGCGLTRGDRSQYVDDLARYVYKSLHISKDSADAQQHAKFRASTVLLIFTLSEAAVIFGPYHSSASVLNGFGWWLLGGGVVVFAVGFWQMIITRCIDYYIVYPPTNGSNGALIETTGPDHSPIDTKAESEAAGQFGKYADVIVAFVVIQNLSFGYALGQENALSKAIIHGWGVILWILLGSGVLYYGLICLCGRWEQSLRRSAGHSTIVLSATKTAIRGRMAIVTITSAIAALGLYLNRQ